MKQKIKSIIVYLPKIFIFGLVLFNFFYIFSQLKTSRLIFSEATPWYEKSVRDVLILLLASASLLMSRRVSYLVSGILRGYVVVVGVFYLFFRKMNLLEQWRGIQEYELNIFLEWEIQFVLAIIIFGFTMFYLIRDILNKNNSQKRLLVGISVALLMFVFGLSASWFYPTFTMTGSIPCDNSYCIYYFQPTLSSDYQAIILYNEFSSAEKSHYLFESNLSNGNLIERKDIVNEKGEKIGERGIVQFSSPNGKDEVRICWTDGVEVWFIAAPSMRLALKFEESQSFQNALKINKLTKPTVK